MNSFSSHPDSRSLFHNAVLVVLVTQLVAVSSCYSLGRRKLREQGVKGKPLHFYLASLLSFEAWYFLVPASSN